MKDYRKLTVWYEAHSLVLHLYQATASFPSTERFGLTSQIRRAGASIPANIAEGCGRGTDTELVRFVQIASGSASELDYHLFLAHDLQLLNDADYHNAVTQLTVVRKKLTAFHQQLRADIASQKAKSQ
jgi:four helix bundle protein